jgi:hypothetical protein
MKHQISLVLNIDVLIKQTMKDYFILLDKKALCYSYKTIKRYNPLLDLNVILPSMVDHSSPFG